MKRLFEVERWTGAAWKECPGLTRAEDETKAIGVMAFAFGSGRYRAREQGTETWVEADAEGPGLGWPTVTARQP